MDTQSLNECIFCRIAKGDEATKIEKEAENFVVFKDINPQAAVHLLIVPRNHIKDLTELEDKLWLELKAIVVAIAREKSVKGFRLVHNAGDAAAIPHLQIHFLADITPDRAQ